MEESKRTRRVYVSEIEGGNVRGRPPVKWRDRVQEYVRERGGRSKTTDVKVVWPHGANGGE